MERKDEEGLPERAPDQLGAPGDEADAPAPFGRVEDASNVPRKLRETSEREQGRSKPKDEANSPGRPGEEPGEPVGETAAVDDAHTYQEGPRGDTSDGSGGTNTPSRDRPPGGHLDDQEESRGVEGVRGRHKVVDRAEYDRIRPRSDRNERDVEPNPPGRDRGPGGDPGERDESGGDEGDRERQSDGDSDEMEGRRGGKDGATSGARRDSKRVDTTPLTAGEPGQHGRRKRRTTSAPEPATPPSIDPRRPTDHPNPPRRRGRLKTRPRRISTRKWTYQVTRTRRGQIGRIGPFGDIVHGL